MCSRGIVNQRREWSMCSHADIIHIHRIATDIRVGDITAVTLAIRVVTRAGEITAGIVAKGEFRLDNGLKAGQRGSRNSFVPASFFE